MPNRPMPSSKEPSCRTTRCILDAVTVDLRDAILRFGFITHLGRTPNETSATPCSRAASRRLFCLHYARPLRFGSRSGNDLYASAACLRRAAELAHADG